MDMVILTPRVKGWDCGLSGERLVRYHGIKEKIASRPSSGTFQVTQARRHSHYRWGGAVARSKPIGEVS